MFSSNEKVLHKIHSNNGFQHQLPSCLAGEVYRLRQPSYKYLTSVTKYDSSNPTKDWDFPCLNLGFLKDVNSEGLDSSLKPSHDTVIAKPFSPNLNHRRFELLKRKVAIKCWNFCMLFLQGIRARGFSTDGIFDLHGISTWYVPGRICHPFSTYSRCSW